MSHENTFVVDEAEGSWRDRRIRLYVRALRKRFGWTQEELAERSGLSRVTIGMYERGGHGIDATTLSHLARVFAVEEHELYGYDVPPTFDLPEPARDLMRIIPDLSPGAVKMLLAAARVATAREGLDCDKPG